MYGRAQWNLYAQSEEAQQAEMNPKSGWSRECHDNKSEFVGAQSQRKRIMKSKCCCLKVEMEEVIVFYLYVMYFGPSSVPRLDEMAFLSSGGGFQHQHALACDVWQPHS